jgi:hypothetical protein
MKLSEAIRQGAALRPQAHGDYSRILEDDTICTCALGAAYEAITGVVPPSIYDSQSALVVDTVLNTVFDANSRTGSAACRNVVRWNDEDGLTREEIAARLEAQGL